MSNRSVVVLVIVALSLAGVVLIFERQISQEVRPTTDEHKVFKAYSSDQVESVSLVNGETAVKLVREADGWQLISPVVAAADEKKVAKLLIRIGELEEVAAPIKAGPGKTINMGTYGLEEPSRKIIVSYGGVQEAALSLGNRTGTEERLYARLGKENRVMIIGAGVSGLLEEIPADKNLYRSRRVFQAKHIDKVLEIHVITSENLSGQPIALQKDQQGGLWALRLPVEDRADQERVLEILGKCAALEASEFIELPTDQTQLAQRLKSYGLTGEEETDIIALAAEGMQKVVLYLGGLDEQKKFRYGLVERGAMLTASQEVVKVPAEFVKSLPKSAEVLRDRKFLRFDDQKAKEVLVKGPAGEMVLVQGETKGKWKLKEDEAGVDSQIVTEFLSEIKGLTAIEFAGKATAEMGFEEPYLVVLITTDQRNKNNYLQIGAEKDGKYRYARLASDKAVRLVSKAAVNNLVRDRLDFYERTLAQVGRYDIKKCTIALPGIEVEAVQKDGQWWLSEPSSMRADNDVMREVIGIMDPLRAERIVANKVADGDEALARYGLDEPRYQIAVAKEIGNGGDEAGKEEYVLMIGKRADEETGESYARLAGGELVFTLGKKTIDQMDKDWRSKKVWPLIGWQVNQLSKVEISGGSEILSLEKPRENWQVTRPKKFWPSQPAVRRMLDALGKLEAVEFGQDGEDKQYGLDEPTMVVRAVLVKVETGEEEEYRFFVGKLIEGKSYAVKTDGENAVRLVAAEKLEPLKVNYLGLRETKVMDIEVKKVEAIEISEKKKKYRVQRVETGWTLTAPAGKAVDMAKLEDVLDVLSNLQAIEIVADTLDDVKKYGLDTPEITVTVEISQDKIHRLLIGDEIEIKDKEKLRPRYAVVEGDSTVFVISGEDAEVLKKEIILEED